MKHIYEAVARVLYGASFRLIRRKQIMAILYTDSARFWGEDLARKVIRHNTQQRPSRNREQLVSGLIVVLYTTGLTLINEDALPYAALTGTFLGAGYYVIQSGRYAVKPKSDVTDVEAYISAGWLETADVKNVSVATLYLYSLNRNAAQRFQLEVQRTREQLQKSVNAYLAEETDDVKEVFWALHKESTGTVEELTQAARLVCAPA